MHTHAANPIRPQRHAASNVARSQGAARGIHQAASGRVPVSLHPQAVLQTKLAVSSPSDAYEQEADRVSDQVIHMPNPQAFTPCACGGGCPRCNAKAGQLGAKRVAQPVGTGQREANPVAAPTDLSPVVARGTSGGGQALDGDTRAFMESRFGRDFGNVRVHANSNAAESARALDALAYTSGRDVVFGNAQYVPGSVAGRRLLAHELTHVIQQRGGMLAGGNVLQRKAKAIRFQDEPTLDEISDGKKVLKEKDKGEAVIRITTALAELGYYTISIIDENFDPVLTTAVSKYQDAKGLKGKVIDGQVEKGTFDKLDQDFSASFGVERDVLGKQKSTDLMKGTQTLDPAEQTASAKAISTEVPVNPVTGLPPTFVHKIVGKGEYEDRLRKAVGDKILAQYDSLGKGKAALHADPKNLYDWTQTEKIANGSKNAVDKVFGEYKKGPALKKGVNIFDAWEDKVNQLTVGGKAKEDSSANWRVEKILSGDSAVKLIDQEHGAIPSRAAEKAIVDKIKADLVTKYRTELIETHKGWRGYAENGKIFIQIFKEGTDDANTKNMWYFYQTFIHEYIHTLEHPDHVAYRNTIDQKKGGFTLREGTTDYFTKIVWSSITIDDALRKTIEGPLNDPKKKFSIPPLNTYDEAKNAERLAGVVGIRNVATAFFLGKVELIGKK
jgi:peptidoglycan hydrolase-like protein with peptidoglycan-binding domain